MNVYEWSRARWLVVGAILLALFATYHVIRAEAGWFESEGPERWPRAAQERILADCEQSPKRCAYLLDAWMSEYSYAEVRAMGPRESWYAAEWVAYRLSD